VLNSPVFQSYAISSQKNFWELLEKDTLTSHQFKRTESFVVQLFYDMCMTQPSKMKTIRLQTHAKIADFNKCSNTLTLNWKILHIHY